MALLSRVDHPLAFSFGLLGNLISFMVYLSPIPTFYRIHRKGSTEGFQSIPYVVGLFSAMLWIYYAIFAPHSGLLISINSFGCFIQTVYICFFIIYAPKSLKIHTVKLLLYLNVGVFGIIVLFTLFLSKGSMRIQIIGWICVSFSVSVFAAPLTIIMKVIHTRSVEYMPIWLSFSLTISAVIWFLYGVFTKDRYVALPNILGFLFGTLQMILYGWVKCLGQRRIDGPKLPVVNIGIVGVGPIISGGGSEVHPIEARPVTGGVGGEEEKPYEPSDRDIIEGVAHDSPLEDQEGPLEV
ncbi:Bidirectional sugar transporter SWEET13 [Acorus calamus]|uniref:Bidirectional sugar transporter SWEET n=1 Tax=Acorus calamus TaxID=4465 RepID=A0AAV9C0R4_ACOCL|nr:Bidirectional sugar transporter SWEET13 [Acorus calamus]